MNEKYMLLAINEAYKSSRTGDFPVGCVITCNSKVISKAHNTRNKSKKTIDHAEIKAITAANKKVKSWRLEKCDMYVTMHPCAMCLNVIKESRITNVYVLFNKDEEKNQYSKTNIYFDNTNDLSKNELIIAKAKYLDIITSFFADKR